jgi:uncharacterized protein YfdQ (DUF2303 family)
LEGKVDIDNKVVDEIAELARFGGSVDLTVTETSIRPDPIPVGRLVDKNGSVAPTSIKAILDEWRTTPERTRGVAKVQNVQSFIELTNRHKNESSAIFVSISDAPTATAVIDYTTVAHEPRFGAHRVHYPFPVSREWQAWKASDGKPMSQTDWAGFVEDRIAELSSPMDAERAQYEPLFQTKIALPSELIQLSRGMQINVEARVKDIRVLQSGESEVLYEEVHKDGAGQKLIIPGLFVVQIPLFIDGDPVRLLVRLRYRRNDGKLTWFYQLYRPDIVMRARLKDDCDTIASETSLPIYEGSPEA